jgi:hypothetical protein
LENIKGTKYKTDGVPDALILVNISFKETPKKSALKCSKVENYI